MEVRIIYSPFHLNRLINTCLQLSLIYWSWVILVITSECGLPIGYVFPQRCKLLKINSSIVVTIKHSCIHERYIIDNQSSHLTLVKQTQYLLILSIIDVQHDAIQNWQYKDSAHVFENAENILPFIQWAIIVTYHLTFKFQMAKTYSCTHQKSN